MNRRTTSGAYIDIYCLPSELFHMDAADRRPPISVRTALPTMPPPSAACEVSAIDHKIASNGGTTSSMEDSPNSLRNPKSKERCSLETRVVELTRTNGYLRQELAYYKELKEAGLKFHQGVSDVHALLKTRLDEYANAQKEAGENLLRYWNIDVKLYDEDILSF